MEDSKIVSFENIRRALEDKKLYAVAVKTGLSYPTIQKLAKGETNNYNLKTLIAISFYIRTTCAPNDNEGNDNEGNDNEGNDNV